MLNKQLYSALDHPDLLTAMESAILEDISRDDLIILMDQEWDR